MKPIHRTLWRKLFVSKRFYFFLLILTALTIRAVRRALNVSTEQSFGSFFLDIYYGVLDVRWFPILIVPFFLLLIGIISDTFDRYQVLLKYKDIKQWWRDKLLGTGLFAMLFNLTIHGLILGAVVVIGQAGDLDAKLFHFLLLSLVMQLVGLLVVGSFYHMITLIFARNHVGLLGTVLVISFIDVVKVVGKWEYLTLPDFMTLTYKWESGYITTNLADLLPVMGWFLVFSVLYMIGSTLFCKKDIYWSE